MVERYQARATVYELGAEFGMNRRTISQHLIRAGVVLRLQPPGKDVVDELIRIYQSGLLLARVGEQVGVSASTAQKYLRARGVQPRDPQGRVRS